MNYGARNTRHGSSPWVWLFFPLRPVDLRSVSCERFFSVALRSARPSRPPSWLSRRLAVVCPFVRGAADLRETKKKRSHGTALRTSGREFLLFDGPGGAMGIGFSFRRRGLFFARKREEKTWRFFFGGGGVGGWCFCAFGWWYTPSTRILSRRSCGSESTTAVCGSVTLI